MRSASGALISLLQSASEFFMADLLTITQVDGTITRLTTWETALTVGGNLYAAGPLTFTRDTTKISVGITVDTLAVTLQTGTGVALAGIPWPQAVRQGALDGARIVLERLFMPTPGDTSAGTIVLFAGRVATANPSRDTVAITVKSDLVLLDTNLPKNIYQPGCSHTLFDGGCALLKTAFANALTTLAGSTATALTATTSRPSGYFDQGTITFTSGVLAGKSFTVKAFTLSGSMGTFAFAKPLPATPAASDTFNAYPGCDKTLSTCSNKFANSAHFRGFPLIPAAEAAI